MAQFIGFGNGSDGNVTLSGTDAPIDSACSGTSGTDSLTATNASFAAGQMILIKTMRGTNTGQYEVNQIKSYVAGTITTQKNLSYSYAGLSQVIVIKQYNNVTITGTFTGKAWNGTTGGEITFACAGKFTNSGTLTASGRGFRSTGTDAQGSGALGMQGEGTGGAGTQTNSANENGGGGGGGNVDSGHVEAGHGGGGGNATSGGTPGARNTSPGGTGGGTKGTADLATMVMGGAGGEGGNGWDSNKEGKSGGPGGGNILLFINNLSVSGSIVSNGSIGTASSDRGGAGGGGAGGSIKIYYRTASIGTSLITATGGAGGTCTGAFGGSGGAGGNGRIALIGCSLSGTTNPTANATTGGQDFCSRQGKMM